MKSLDGRIENEFKIDESIDKMLKDLPDYVSEWNLNLKASRKTASTRKDFIMKIRLFLRSIDSYDTKAILPSAITAKTVTEFFISSQTKMVKGTRQYTSDSYQQTIWSCLNNFLDFMQKKNYIQDNHIRYITRPSNHDLDRINRDRVLLTAKDFKKIIGQFEGRHDDMSVRDKAIMLLFMNTGMRKTALANINISDIVDRTILVTDKGNKTHEYLLNDATANAIYDWLQVRARQSVDHDHLFVSNRGNKMSGNALYSLVEKYTKAALGKAVSPHKLRSGYCSILYKKTGDIEFVRRAVGHANAATTQRYIVTKGEEKKKAAEIMGSIF